MCQHRQARDTERTDVERRYTASAEVEPLNLWKVSVHQPEQGTGVPLVVRKAGPRVNRISTEVQRALADEIGHVQ